MKNLKKNYKTKTKNFKQLDSERTHGKFKYRRRKQEEQEVNKELKDWRK